MPTTTISGSTGSSGTATLTARLESYPDYGLGVDVIGTGAIAIDDIRITNSSGQLVASENAEGPTLVPGPLNFQLTDAIALKPDADAWVRSAASKDLDGDGHPETILTLTAPRPSTTPLVPILIESRGRMRLATTEFFPAGPPTVNHSPATFFADLNNDGRDDIVFADAGADAPPWTGSVVGVGLSQGGGRYRNVSPLVPADLHSLRQYALAVGDIDGDGRVEILLPDKESGANTALLRWNGNGFDAQRNWIPSNLWRSPGNLYGSNWLVMADLDSDGRQDLLAAGQPHQINLRVLYGAAGGYTATGLIALPDGPFGHHTGAPPAPVRQGSDMGPVVVADFNNDGLPDIVDQETQTLDYAPGAFTDTNDPDYAFIRANGGTVVGMTAIRVLVNEGSRKFADISAASSAQILGRRHYQDLIPIDLDNDGFLDIVGTYQTSYYAGVRTQWGTTLFLNDGTGAFQVVDGTRLLAGVTTTPTNGQTWSLGSFVPTIVNAQRIEGIVFENVAGCGGAGFCAVPGLNLYKVVANRGIGTGPDFADSASLGVPGFNEFYYLRRYPEAAAAVRAGTFRSGLEHYVAVGASRGYRRHAPTSALLPNGSLRSDNRSFRLTYQADGNVVLYDDRSQTPLWATNTGGTPAGTFVMQSDGNLVVRDGQRVIRWESGTSGNPGAYFVLADDGNLVIFNAAGTPIWDRRQPR